MDALFAAGLQGIQTGMAQALDASVRITRAFTPDSSNFFAEPDWNNTAMDMQVDKFEITHDSLL